MATALEIKDLEKTYAGADGRPPTRALNGISLTVPKGDFYALLGPNGAGKTTMIGIVTGLVNKTGGTVVIDGTDFDKEPERARKHVGVVPQNLNVDFFGKAIDIVVNQAGYYGIPRSVAVPRAEEILKAVGLGDKLTASARTLSGGMQRRLMIARALIHEPDLLFLDEPTAGVDIEMRRSMWDYLKTLTAKGVTILLTTHYLEEAEQLAKHVAIINKGVIAASGTMNEILALHKEEEHAGGYRGSKLEEVFLQLTKDNAQKS